MQGKNFAKPGLGLSRASLSEGKCFQCQNLNFQILQKILLVKMTQKITREKLEWEFLANLDNKKKQTHMWKFVELTDKRSWS